jgi:hypothetical protein
MNQVPASIFGGNDPKAPPSIAALRAFTEVEIFRVWRKTANQSFYPLTAGRPRLVEDVRMQMEVIREAEETQIGEALPVHRNGVGPDNNFTSWPSF